MHYHPANCSVALGEAMWRMTDVDGEVTETDGEGLGVVNCGDADVHLPANAGESASEVILVEFKGRETFDR